MSWSTFAWRASGNRWSTPTPFGADGSTESFVPLPKTRHRRSEFGVRRCLDVNGQRLTSVTEDVDYIELLIGGAMSAYSEAVAAAP
jgi:hypothetical protein